MDHTSIRVPNELHSFKKLLSLCGVRNSFEIRDYLQSLQRLKKEFQDNPLTDSAVRVAGGIISEIISMHLNKDCDEGIEDGSHTSIQDEGMYVLDDQCILRKPSELTYNDMPLEGKNVKMKFILIPL